MAGLLISYAQVYCCNSSSAYLLNTRPQLHSIKIRLFHSPDSIQNMCSCCHTTSKQYIVILNEWCKIIAEGKKCIFPTLLQCVTVFIACGVFFSEDVSIGKAVREIFLMCLCYSMSLEAISLPQRGSAEGVTLFCVLIGLLSRTVEEDNFWNFILIVISSLARWKFILCSCKRVLFSEIK